MTEEIINPKQAHAASVARKEIEDRSKIKLSGEKVFYRGDKKLKKLTYQRMISGKWCNDHSKIIYLGKKSKGA